MTPLKPSDFPRNPDDFLSNHHIKTINDSLRSNWQGNSATIFWAIEPPKIPKFVKQLENTYELWEINHSYSSSNHEMVTLTITFKRP